MSVGIKRAMKIYRGRHHKDGTGKRIEQELKDRFEHRQVRRKDVVKPPPVQHTGPTPTGPIFPIVIVVDSTRSFPTISVADSYGVKVIR